MTEKIITKKDVEYVAKLSRVAITDADVAKYQDQLERILGYVGKLKEADTKNVAPSAHPLELSNVWRDDAAKPFPDREALFKNAPEMEETFYRVKKVIE